MRLFKWVRDPAGWAWLGLGALALGLRLRLPGYTEMGGDQSVTLGPAMEWVRGGAFPLVSMKSSFGLYHFPLVEYLYALALWPRGEVRDVVGLIAVCNLAGLFFLAWALARSVGKWVGWWAALLLAVNPWAAYYGQLIWMPSFVPGFAAAYFACLLLCLAEAPRRRYLVGGALALAGTVQLHPAGAVLLPVSLALAACFPRRWWPQRRWLLAAGALAGLTFTPWMVFEIRNGFPSLVGLSTGLGQAPQTNAAALLIELDLLRSAGIYSTLGAASARYASLDPYGPLADRLASWGLGLAALSASLHLARAGLMRRGWEARAVGRLVMLVWLAAPAVLFARHTNYLQNYYFLYAYPALVGLLALEAEAARAWLAARWPRRAAWAALVWAPLALLACQQARVTVIGQDLRAAGLSGRQRVVEVQAAIAAGRELLAARPGCELVVMSAGQGYEDSPLGLLRAFLSPARVRFAPAASGRLRPAACALYLLTEPEPEARAWLEARAQPLPAATIRTPEQTWLFFDAPAWTPTDPAAAPLGDWPPSVRLWRAAAPATLAAGQTLTVRAEWSLLQPQPAPRAVHFALFILRPDGSLLAQQDGAFLDAADWQAGDALETTLRLPLPTEAAPGAYRLALALYYYPEIERLPLAAGGDLLDLGPLQVTAE